MPNQPRANVDANGNCERCGHHHERCVGHNRAGKPCGKHPIRGGDVCRTHGGAAGHVRAAATRRLAAAEADRELRKAIDQVDVIDITDPVVAFQAITAEALALKDYFAERVADLNDQLRFTDDKGAEHLDARVALYERALDRVAKFLEAWIRLDMDERLVRIQERQAVFVADAITAALAELGVDVEDVRVRTTVASHLRSIDGGKAA